MKKVVGCILIFCLICLSSCGKEKTEVKSASSDEPIVSTDYYEMYTEYLYDILLPEKGQGKEMDYSFEELGINSESYISALIPYVDGICSVYMNDFNCDSIPEMITVEIEKQFSASSQSNEYNWYIYVDLYSVENSAVTYKERIYETTKFRNADERVYIYTLKNEGALCLCVAENFWEGACGSSVFGDKLKMFSVESDNTAVVKHDIMYYYNRGNSFYKYNEDEYALLAEGAETREYAMSQSAIKDVFNSIGLSEFNNENGSSYCRFPDITEHDKIFSGGTEMFERGGRAFVKNYTDRINIDVLGDTSGLSETVTLSSESVFSEAAQDTTVLESLPVQNTNEFNMPQNIAEVLNKTLGDLYGTVPAPADAFQGTWIYAPQEYTGLLVHYPVNADITDKAVLVECDIGMLFQGKESCTYQELKDIFGDELGDVDYTEMGPGSYFTHAETNEYSIEFKAFEENYFTSCYISYIK